MFFPPTTWPGYEAMKNPKENCWYSTSPIWRKKLAQAVSNMCKECGIRGFEQTTPYVLQQQHICMLQELTNNLSWNTQAIAALRVSILTSVYTSSEQQQAVSDIRSKTKKHIAQMLPFHNQQLLPRTDNVVVNKRATERTTVTKWHGRRYVATMRVSFSPLLSSDFSI